MNSTHFMTAALITGALVPFQLAFNAQLGAVTKSPYSAGLIVFLVGAATLGVTVVLLRQTLPSIADLVQAPPTIWLGGIIAVLYILAIIVVTPKLGIGTTAVLVIAGQLMTALVLDHFGAFGNALHTINWPRAAGALMVVFGVYLIRAN